MYEPIPALPLHLQPDDFILSGVSLKTVVAQ